jgi:hypothetical protein
MPGRIEIVDLGAHQDTEAGPVPPKQTTVRRRGAKAVVTGVAALLILVGVQVSQTSNQAGPEAVETAAEEPDVCEEVAQANDAELRQAKLSSDRDAVPAVGKGYSLLGAWPAGSDHTVTYGRLYPDQSIEICGQPKDLAALGITSSARQEDWGRPSRRVLLRIRTKLPGVAQSEAGTVGCAWGRRHHIRRRRVARWKHPCPHRDGAGRSRPIVGPLQLTALHDSLTAR